MDRMELIRDTWRAWLRGDFATVEAALAPDARWLAVEDGPWNCESRAQILNVMRQNHKLQGGGPAGEVEEITPLGDDHVLVGFRPDDPNRDDWPLDAGIRYVVLRVTGGLVTEMKGCATRQAALAYASST